MSKKKNKAKKVNKTSKKSEPQQTLFETELSIPTSWNMTSEDRYVYAFHNNASPKLLINQISIYGMELTPLNDGGYEATGLIRSTVPQGVKFEPTTILLLGSKKDVIAKKEFNLNELGTIPTNGARPWKFLFSKSDFVKEINPPLNNWSLAFELKQEHQLDLEESWEKSIADETKQHLEEIIKNSAPLKPGEVNFLGLSAKQNEDMSLATTVLIRNGSDKDITLEQIPLAIKDASGKKIAQGSFKLDNFTVKSNTSKPWTFIFPSTMVTEKELDLSRWTAYIVQ